MGAEHQNYKSSLYQRLQPYMAVIIARFCYAGFNIIVKLALDRGMSNYTLVVYGNAVAVPSTGIFAFMFERKGRPKITLPILLNIFILGLLGMEKVEIRKLNSQAKVVGTLVSVGGAILMTLYKGHVVLSVIHKHSSSYEHSEGTVDKNWIKGSICLIVHSISFAACYVMQAMVVAKYPAPFSLTTLVSLMGCLQGAVATSIFERKASVWKIGWDVTLLAILYSGIVVFGVSSYLQLLAMQKRGPVFVTAFSPLSTLIVAIMAVFILGEILHVGGVVGAALIVTGLYMVLWGKERDNKKSTQQEQSSHRSSPVNNNGHQTEGNDEVVTLKLSP